MPKYRITAPNGKTYEVSAPDGASQDQVLAYVQSQQAESNQPWQPKKRGLAELQAMAGNHDSTEGMSGTSKFFAGMGKSLIDTKQGLQQLGAEAADYVNPQQQTMPGLIAGNDPSRGAAIQSLVDERRRLDADLMDTGAGLTGNIAGQVGQLFIPAGAAAKSLSYAGKGAGLLRAAAASGAFSATQPVGTGESRAQNVAIGAALGAGGEKLATGVGALARGAKSRLDPVARQLADKAEQYGIKLGVPDLSQNPLVRTVASQMERLPFSGATARNTARQEQLNRKVGETFGVDAPKITPEVFAVAKANLQDTFETLATRNSLPASPRLLSRLGQIRGESSRLATSDTSRAVNGWIDELISKADQNGVIPGKANQAFDSASGAEMKAGGPTANALGKIRNAAREAMDLAISPQDRAAWKLVRQQYAALKTVEPLVAKSATGDISAAELMGRVTADKSAKGRMAAGNGGVLGDLARIGQRYLKGSPNSGTADRALVNATVGTGLYGAQQAGFIDPETALWTAGLLGGNRAALKALNSRALSQGGSRTLNGLSRITGAAPRLLPAMANASRSDD